MEDGHCKCENVSDDQEVNLCPHELMLRVPAPFDEDAILTRSAKLTRSQDVELIVSKAEAPPNASNSDRPHNQEDLESEMEHHTRATNISDAQVGIEWVELAADVTDLLCSAFAIIYGLECFRGGVQLHVGPMQIATLQSRIVDVRSGAQINHCCKSKQTHACEDANDNVQSDNVRSLALAIWSHIEEHDAFLACVRAIQDVVLAIFHHRTSAGVVAVDHIWDGTIRISGGALGPRNAYESAPSIPAIWELVVQVLCVVRALCRALLVL
jgi:hypothetical protein